MLVFVATWGSVWTWNLVTLTGHRTSGGGGALSHGRPALLSAVLFLMPAGQWAQLALSSRVSRADVAVKPVGVQRAEISGRKQTVKRV